MSNSQILGACYLVCNLVDNVFFFFLLNHSNFVQERISDMTSRISKIARKSVVIIADKRDEDAYCSGCVMVKDGAVIVIAVLRFCEGAREATEGCLF